MSKEQALESVNRLVEWTRDLREENDRLQKEVAKLKEQRSILVTELVAASNDAVAWRDEARRQEALAQEQAEWARDMREERS